MATNSDIDWTDAIGLSPEVPEPAHQTGLDVDVSRGQGTGRSRNCACCYCRTDRPERCCQEQSCRHESPERCDPKYRPASGSRRINRQIVPADIHVRYLEPAQLRVREAKRGVGVLLYRADRRNIARVHVGCCNFGIGCYSTPQAEPRTDSRGTTSSQTQAFAHARRELVQDLHVWNHSLGRCTSCQVGVSDQSQTQSAAAEFCTLSTGAISWG